MALHDEEARIDAADWGAERPFVRDGREELFRRETQGTFETPQDPTLERRRGGDWSGPGRRSTDPDIARFHDDGGPA